MGSDTVQSFSTIALPETRRLPLGKYFGFLITAAQMVVDWVAVCLAFFIAYWFYTGPLLSKSAPQSLVEFFTVAFGAAFIYIFVLDRVGLYKREVSFLNIKELRGVFYAGLYGAAIILSASFYIRSTSFSRITITVAILLAPILIYFGHQIFYFLHIYFHQRGWSTNKVLIFGAGRIGQHLGRRMFESPGLGLLPIGFLDDDVAKKGQTVTWRGGGLANGMKILGGEEVISNLKDQQIDLLVIALPDATLERNKQIVDACIKNNIGYAVVPNAHEEFIQQMEMFEIGEIPLFRRREHKLNPTYAFFKRVMDFFGALSLMLVLSPLYLLFAVLIKLDSPGPVIFKQKRVGQDGKIFSFYKFRSMYQDMPQYALTPNSLSDPRITKLGIWLRRSSLDELPQLFNVLRGDMSLVGPRPEMPFIVSEYSPLQRQRLRVKPGITGVWQISAYRGEPIHENIEYDLFYIQNRSLLLDLAILVKTFLSVVKGVGAF